MLTARALGSVLLLSDRLRFADYGSVRICLSAAAGASRPRPEARRHAGATAAILLTLGVGTWLSTSLASGLLITSSAALAALWGLTRSQRWPSHGDWRSHASPAWMATTGPPRPGTAAVRARFGMRRRSPDRGETAERRECVRHPAGVRASSRCVRRGCADRRTARLGRRSRPRHETRRRRHRGVPLARSRARDRSREQSRPRHTAGGGRACAHRRSASRAPAGARTRVPPAFGERVRLLLQRLSSICSCQQRDLSVGDSPLRG